MIDSTYRRGNFRVVLAVMAAAVGPMLPLRAQAKPDSVPAARSLEELRTQLQAIVTKNKLPGAGIALVSKDSLIWAGGVGLADLAARHPITGETHFRVGSVSKSFIALGILMLQERGKVSLDTKLSEVVPDVTIDNPWEATRPLRVVNLLDTPPASTICTSMRCTSAAARLISR